MIKRKGRDLDPMSPEGGNLMIKKAKKIQRLVEQILVQNEISSLPIDVFLIANNKGIDIIPGDLGDISGLLFRDGSRITIGVNQNHSETRKRFTIAHEIGHLILHGDQPLHVDKVFAVKLRSHVSSEAVDLEEIEANKRLCCGIIDANRDGVKDLGLQKF